MSMIEQLSGPAKALLNPSIEDWRQQGKKVLAYYCPYVPEEMIVAAGMMPFAMRATGSASSEEGDIYAHSATCSFIRHILDHAMNGAYNFLDGFISIDCCDPFRRMFDVWRRKRVPVPEKPLFLQILSVPKKVTGEEVLPRLINEFAGLKDNMERYFGLKITDEDLRRAIKTCNESRRLLKEVYALRKRPAPPLTGGQALEMMIAATSLPKEECNSLLKELLAELSNAPGQKDYQARLMVIGSNLDNPDYLAVMEELGGLVVADYFCNGAMYFWEPVDETLPPLEALAGHVLKSPSCPRMIGDFPRRLELIREMVKDYRVDGIIVQRLMFCDIWGAEATLLRWEARKTGLPLLVLEREYALSGVGQLKTRVQAFLETIRR
jgi:benzoyl-CoA reductase/2-hydroxyglutaryl-CoA dehydratase subunit BcrC/BadD/HgdB